MSVSLCSIICESCRGIPHREKCQRGTTTYPDDNEFAFFGQSIMSYTMYRETTLGSALTHTLDEFVEEGMISRTLAAKVLAAFDANINKALAYRVRNKDVLCPFERRVDKLKIVACEAMPPVLPISIPDPE